ncbi:phage baseplate assembly protein V, partial [Nonomuraea zeae]
MAVPDGSAPSYFGVYPAIVTDLVDPDKLGRVEVRYPWLGDDGDRDVRAWATLCSPYADDGQGLQILPEVGSQVVVGFEAGNPRRPYVLGSAWNGRAATPIE